MKKVKNWLFDKIHGNNLVYNACWEDPRCDRELLQLNQDSEVVMITSAGCNALTYLLDSPRKINCVDVNPRQNALLELKKSFFKIGDHESLFACFGTGKLDRVEVLYIEKIRNLLPAYAQKYWDKNIAFFNGKGLRKSFYYRGTSGLLAWMFSNYIRLKKQLNDNVEQFLQATSLEQQAQLYSQIENQIWSRPVEWVMNRHLVLSLAGVPKSQQQLFMEKYDNGAVGFMQECMKNVFTQVPVCENYFWQLYFNGAYEENCCPEYLRKENYLTISNSIDKVAAHTTTVSQFLKSNSGEYSHFILLDHQDWLAENDWEALEEEWELILKNSRPGSKILMRSAAEEIDFFPGFVLDQVEFQKEWTDRVHRTDRVGTYASTYLGVVK